LVVLAKPKDRLQIIFLNDLEMKTKMLSVSLIRLSGLLLISLLLLLLAATNLISFNYKAQAQQQQQTNAANNTKVQVGGGNNTYPFFGYNPQQIQVKVGSSVVWSTPSNAPVVPHTVSFVLNSSTMTGPDRLFAVPSSTKFIPLSPDSNSEPDIVPGSTKNGMETVLVYNGRSYNPTVIDSTGNVKTAPPNSTFTMTGSEQYINSGWLVSTAGKTFFPGSSSTFGVTFQKAGTYSYLCELHPWMVGVVDVK
jgi:plastocyanin